MEEKTEVILLLGNLFAELKNVETHLSKIENKLTNLSTSTKKELRSVFNTQQAPKTKFTIKRTVIDK